MDLDNIGPIALFIVYMAISGWAKQKKARQRNKPVEKSQKPASGPMAKPMQEVGGILEQLKKELFEIDEEPLRFQQVEPEPEIVEEMEIPEVETVPTPQFVEGSGNRTEKHPLAGIVVEVEDTSGSGQSLQEVLEPYSTVAQGIILHEILGKPRSRQENDEWFHRS